MLVVVMSERKSDMFVGPTTNSADEYAATSDFDISYSSTSCEVNVIDAMSCGDTASVTSGH